MIKVGTRHYVNIEQAKLLKKLGFDWEVNACYSAIKEELYTSLPLTNYNDPDENDFFGEDGEEFGGYGQKPYSAPMLIEVQEWLRKEKNISIELASTCYLDTFVWNVFIRHSNNPINVYVEKNYKPFYDYEDALSAAISSILNGINDDEDYE